jgi:hypothetical protein
LFDAMDDLLADREVLHLPQIYKSVISFGEAVAR